MAAILAGPRGLMTGQSSYPPTRLVPIGEIARMLNARIDSLAPELLPQGKRIGHEWTALPPWRAGGKLGQLNIHLGGAKAGVWMDFVANKGGDALDLVAEVLCAGDKGRAVTWARRWLGIDSGNPADLEKARRATPSPAETQAKGEAEARKMRDLALRRWLEGGKVIAGTPVDWYLAGRGINLAELGRAPGAIRYHPGLHSSETQGRWPAMVTAITGPGGFIACHRTYLQVTGPGAARKAPMGRPKVTLGLWRGGHIALWRGASGKPLREAPDGEIVDITEGIEDGLSVAAAAPESRVIACIALGNLGSLVLPPQIGGVQIWRQNDTAKEAIRAFSRGVDALLERKIRVWLAEVPAAVKDANDLLRLPDDQAEVVNG